MVEIDGVVDILNLYEEITVNRTEEEIVFFSLYGKEYGCWYPDIEQDTSSPFILVKNEEQYDYPHILPTSIPIDQSKAEKYRYICLYETDNTIKFLQTTAEKVRDAIERLIALLSLSDIEKEREFQKEFLFYWNYMAENSTTVQLYIEQTESFQRMNAYRDSRGEIRFVSNGIKLSDADKKSNGKKNWNHLPQLPVFYIPITDKRRILPPTYSKDWTIKDLLKIIKGREYPRIAHTSYLKLNQERTKTDKVGLVFEMIVDENHINFAMIVKLKNTRNDTVLNKLEQDTMEMQIIKSKRVDYYHLCRQIGNDTSLLNKKILLIGAGSLGSYAAKALVKSGIKEITIYDQDTLEDENIFRHTSESFWTGHKKVYALGYDLENIHPEIHIHAVPSNIDDDSIMKELEKVDMIIFTVGSSDVQLHLNKLLKQSHCEKTVIYTWLEAGGTDSHILAVDYRKRGCYQCLFTNEYGESTNNKVNQISDRTLDRYKIRNGCGATRVAYGNAILLRTVSALLSTVQMAFDGNMLQNTLINITPTDVTNTGNQFAEGKCLCCGSENNE